MKEIRNNCIYLEKRKVTETIELTPERIKASVPKDEFIFH